MCYNKVWSELIQVKSRKRIHKLQGASKLVCAVLEVWFVLKCYLLTALSSEASKSSQRENCWVKHSRRPAPVTGLSCYRPPLLLVSGLLVQKGTQNEDPACFLNRNIKSIKVKLQNSEHKAVRTEKSRQLLQKVGSKSPSCQFQCP